MDPFQDEQRFQRSTIFLRPLPLPRQRGTIPSVPLVEGQTSCAMSERARTWLSGWSWRSPVFACRLPRFCQPLLAWLGPGNAGWTGRVFNDPVVPTPPHLTLVTDNLKIESAAVLHTKVSVTLMSLKLTWIPLEPVFWVVFIVADS